MAFRSTVLVLALSAAAAPAAAKVDVVATLPSLGAIARVVGGDDVEVASLSAPNEDPHYVDPRPDLVLRLSRADLLVTNGLDLEIGWLPPLQTGSRNARVQPGGEGFLDAATLVAPLEVPGGQVSRAMGDIHPGGNPHYLFDPRQAARVALGIAARLSTIDPAHAAGYSRRAEAYATELRALADSARRRFAKLAPERRQVVSYHRSFAYLYDWLGLTEIATIEPKPGLEPNPGHVASVLQKMRAGGVRTIVQEEFYPRSTSQTLAKLGGATLVVLPGGARFDAGQSYHDHLAELTEALHAAVAK